jgi:hypothetical protein
MQDSEKQQPKKRPQSVNGHNPIDGMPDVSRRAHLDSPEQAYQDEETAVGVLPARHLPYALIAGVAAGILAVLLNIAIILLNTPTFQTAAREGVNITQNTAFALVGLQCLSFFTTVLICFAAGFLVGKLTVERRMGFFAGALAGAIAYMASFLTRYIPNYPGNIASSGSNGGAVIGAIAIVLLFLVIQGLIGGGAGFLGARTATRKHPYYVVHEE